MERRGVYPFTAIVGQKEMKEALILNTVYPEIGGVLIRGEKGTAKSTTVRALADLLPDRDVVKGCPCGCTWGEWDQSCPDCRCRHEDGTAEPETVPMRVVDLPLSSTEDRVVGTMDLEHAISTGKKRFEPGILAEANGNILYVDEVNLLDDHVVDLLLDAAAMGVNYIEREGISYSHPSRFMLVGTMNPEEGDLRPQLLDRFGLMVDVKGEQDRNARLEVIRRRMMYERDPDGFREMYEESNAELRDRIVCARRAVKKMEPSESTLDAAVRISLHLGVEGHRSDLTMVRTACARAALDGRDGPTPADVVSICQMVLSHRMRRTPFQDEGLAEEGLEEWLRGLLSTYRCATR